ncbi:MAG: translation initiation factor IF-2 associated domain-containing protein, partial [Phenylobacterium sp.]|nr:translation initiation factor IF-2 associated domain-containing protein [Phenylobacterium sp.]
MSDQNDNNDQGSKPAAPAPTPGSAPARPPLTLKPRAAGSVSSGTVRQSFSHGRTKTVVVETKRRLGAAPGAPERPRPAAFDVKARPQPQAPAPVAAPVAPREVQLPGGLSAEEMEARRKAI